MTLPRSRRPLDATVLPLAGRVWRDWLSPQRGRLALALVLMGVVAATTGLYPLLIERAYAVFESRDATLLAMVPLAVVLVTAVKGAALYGQTVLTTAVVERAAADLRGRMFDHLTAADPAQLQAEPAGRLITLFLGDVDAVRVALSRVLTGLVRDALTVVSLVASMIYLDWVLSLACLVMYPLAALPITRIGRYVRRVARQAQAQTGDMTALLTESLAAGRLIKTYRLEAHEVARATAAFEANNRLAVDAVEKRARLEPTLEVLGGLAVAAVIGFAGWHISHGTGSVGEFTGFVGALLIAAQPVRAIGTLNTVVQEGLASAERIFALLDREPLIRDRADAVPLRIGPGAVALERVGFRYAPGGPATLSDLDVAVAPGSTVALVGPSGAGKSTVLNLLLRFHDPDTGTVRIDGQDIAAVTLASLRAATAYVGQDAILFNDTVRANIAFGRPGADADAAAVEAAARSAAAHDFIVRLPAGYDTVVGDRGATLSGGERQRVALARAFLKNAPILLLDEPTSALDSESERVVQQALDRLRAGRTTLVIAHRLSTVRHADRILVMEAGRVVEDGRHDTLLAAGGLYARLCRIQFGEDA